MRTPLKDILILLLDVVVCLAGPGSHIGDLASLVGAGFIFWWHEMARMPLHPTHTFPLTEDILDESPISLPIQGTAKLTLTLAS